MGRVFYAVGGSGKKQIELPQEEFWSPNSKGFPYNFNRLQWHTSRNKKLYRRRMRKMHEKRKGRNKNARISGKLHLHTRRTKCYHPGSLPGFFHKRSYNVFNNFTLFKLRQADYQCGHNKICIYGTPSRRGRVESSAKSKNRSRCQINISYFLVC